MSRQPSSARELTRRLVAQVAAESDAPDVAADAVHVVCERVYQELSRWLGANGCQALFTRSLAQAQAEHPVLGQIRLGIRSEPVLEGVLESSQAHGDAAVAAGLEALLVALLELLGRLIGNDMAGRLVERSVPHHTRHDERPT
jgi:hypothetical protein